MSIPDVEVSARAVDPVTVVAVLAIDGVPLDSTLAAVTGQAYGVAATFVVGGDADQIAAARLLGVEAVASPAALAAQVGNEVEFVWLIHGDAEARPDALGNLVSEAVRNDAAVVGSKILDAERRDHLEAVGGATDVFGEPYLGLDEDEVDLEQYDVVRDVAYVSAVSFLIRRDLLKGLQGLDPLLAPTAAGIDLSQRARLAGARVMVVPSSEVFHARACRHDVAGWREQASRMRAMFKSYSLVTLAWVIPVGFVVGVIDGLARFGLRQFRPLFDYLKASGWNLLRLPSTWSARRALATVRHAPDEELFRYQLSGSLRLRTLATDYGSRFGWIMDREPGVVTEEEMEDDSSVASTIVLGIVLFVAAVATRRLWLGPAPGTGTWLPLDATPWSTLQGYAGGWNPAGLGSPEPVRPMVAIVAFLHTVLVGWGGTAQLLAVASVVAGITGLSRLLDLFGVEGASRHLAGLVYVAGPLALALGGAGQWHSILALGPLAWACVWVLQPAAKPVGRLARWVVIGFAGAAGSLWFPLMIAAAAGAALLVLRIGWRPLAGSLVVGLSAALVASPYLLAVEPEALLADGRPFWPAASVAVAGVLAIVLTIVGGTERTWRVAAWGGLLAAGGVAVASVATLGVEAQSAGLLLGTLGLAAATGAAFSHDPDAPLSRRTVQTMATLAAVVVLFSGAGAALDGGWGLDATDWEDRLQFVGALAGDPAVERTLLIGPAGSLPGEARRGASFEYRLVNGEALGFDEAWLPALRRGDRAMADTIDAIAGGGVLRPGSMLAPFAVRWIVVVEDDAFADVFDAQVDVREVSVAPGVRVFENGLFTPRAFAQAGPWTIRGSLLEGDVAGPVRLADNFDPGWGGSPDSWANSIPATGGTVDYQPDPLRLALATAAGVVLLLALVGLWLGRERT